METVLEIIKSDMFLVGIICFCFILFLLYMINIIQLRKMKKEYKEFMEKLGNGTNIEDMLNKHIEKINKTITKNEELEKFCKSLDSEMAQCIQKIRNI